MYYKVIHNGVRMDTFDEQKQVDMYMESKLDMDSKPVKRYDVKQHNKRAIIWRYGTKRRSEVFWIEEVKS